MKVRVKILIVVLLISIVPTSIVALYVTKNVIPQYENITYNYFVNQQQEVLKKIVDKTFNDMSNIAKDYSIWNEIYEAVLKGDKQVLDFYWTSWLSGEPFNFSIVIGFDNKKNILGEFSKFQSLDSFDYDQLKNIISRVINSKYEAVSNINNIAIERGFVQLKNHIYAFICSPILDDMNLSRPPVGVLFVAKEINVFLSELKPYFINNVYFDKNKADKNAKILVKNRLKIYDIKNSYIGNVVFTYNEKPLIDIKKRLENIFAAIFVLLVFLTLLISVIGGMYFSRKIISLEDYAISMFSEINGEGSIPKPSISKKGSNIRNIELILSYFAKDIKNKVSQLKNQDKLLRELFEKERKNFEGAIQLLISIIEMKDPYTKGHAERVRYYSKRIGQKLISQKGYKLDIFNLEIAAYLHDIGKVAVPESILNKKGKLTDEEYFIVKKHSTDGYNILSNIEYFNSIRDIVLYHHENIDGSGYPVGIEGDMIPIESRIIAVADVFDALTTDRPYRKAYNVVEAVKIMKADVGKKFDPVIFETFLQILYEEKTLNVEMKIDGQV